MVNSVILVGRLGADIELHYAPSGTAVANLSLATNRTYKGSDGQAKRETEWHRVVVFGKTAENCKEFTRKGSKIAVEGRLQTHSYPDPKHEGELRYQTEVVASRVQFLDAREQVRGSQTATPTAEAEEEGPF